MIGLPTKSSQRRENSIEPHSHGDYEQLVQGLEEMAKGLAEAHLRYAVLFIVFCEAYGPAYRRARQRGNDEVQRLNGRLGIKDKNFAHKAREVAKHCHLLRLHEPDLPDSRDAIYELARHESKSPGAIERFVATGLVSKCATVRNLRQGDAPVVEEVMVRLCSTDRNALARGTAAILASTPSIVAKVADSTLRDAIKAAAGADQFGEIEARLTK